MRYKFVPVHSMKACAGGKLWLQPLLNTALGRDERGASSPGSLYTRGKGLNEQGAGWAPRMGPSASAKKKSHALSGNQTTASPFPARCQIFVLTALTLEN